MIQSHIFKYRLYSLYIGCERGRANSAPGLRQQKNTPKKIKRSSNLPLSHILQFRFILFPLHLDHRREILLDNPHDPNSNDIWLISSIFTFPSKSTQMFQEIPKFTRRDLWRRFSFRNRVWPPIWRQRHQWDRFDRFGFPSLDHS